MQRAKLCLLATLLLCLVMNFHQWHRPNLADFQVYDAASELVHEHNSVHMYDGADTGALFSLKFVDSSSPLGEAAQRIGVGRVRLYIYPPILADMVLPFTFVSAAVAGKLWVLLNLMALLVITWLVALVVGIPVFSLRTLIVLVGALSLYATGMCLIWGQVTIVLLMLWMAGIAAYMRGASWLSALLFALATAIKLTPLIVIVPMLFWREWKWVRAYAVFLALCFGLMAVVNTPASLNDYFFHVMPAMSGGGVPDFENKSLLSCAQLLYVTLHHGNPLHVTMKVPNSVIVAAKAVSVLVLLLAIALIARLGRAMDAGDRLMTLALFGLLSVCVAPISWKHAYVAALLPLCFLWAEALREKISAWALLLLTFCSIELGSFFFDDILHKFAHGPVFGVLCFVAPATGIVLVFSRLLQMKPQRLA